MAAGGTPRETRFYQTKEEQVMSMIAQLAVAAPVQKQDGLFTVQNCVADALFQFPAQVQIIARAKFLLQEFNRESNTIGSKGNDLEQARTVVDLKAELEKIREQTQNIE